MRARLILLSLFCAVPLVAQETALRPDAAWHELLACADREQKPVVVFFRSADCRRCDALEQVSVAHPTIQRRLERVVFGVLPADAGEAAALWSSSDPGVAFFDRSGVLRARWPIVPDTTNLGIILDSVTAVAPHFERAVALSGTDAAAGEVEAAAGLAKLGRIGDARAALARAGARGGPETRQAALVTGAVLDANEGKVAQALAELRQVAASAATPQVAAEAWMAAGAIHRATGAADDAVRAFTAAADAAEAGSPMQAAAQRALDALRAARPVERGAIRILPLGHQVVTGRQTVRTHVSSAAVARVSVSLDGGAAMRIDRPPFSAALDFGSVPERRSVRVVAFNRKGEEVGRDERVFNDAGEAFGLRLLEPRSGFVSGAVRVSLHVRTPAARRIRRVAVSWNDAGRAVLTTGPWETTIEVPAGQVGILRAVAELDDGRTSEDAVLLNAMGAVDRVDVQLVELPVSVIGRKGTVPPLTAERITVREGNQVRRVESLATAAETPLTVGLLIDISDSMQKTLPDLQEAAIRFLSTVLGERDRAFLVTFDSRAHLVQPATSDVALLQRQIMNIRPNGLTALHDAMVLGLLQFEGIKGRRAMVVFTDGLDRTSEYGAAEVRELAKRVNVPIHLVQAVPWSPAHGGSWVADPPDLELQRVTRATGGIAHTLRSLAELPDVYARIENALRAQFLAFVRTDAGTRENEWRGVQVSVEGEGLEVFAPEGYYAPW